ncbi:MAG: hypothetical protein ACOYOH_10280, partial [Paracraurococcus sp.]
MTELDRPIAFVCSCEDTMRLDGTALARGCAARGTELRTAEQLCRSQLDRFLAALGERRPITVACTQEAPLFAQEAAAAGSTAPLGFVNVREQAGWSREGAAAGPKMAGLLAAAAVPLPPTPLVPLKSEGVTLVLGRDAAAIAAAERLADRLDLTVLLTGAEAVTPARSAGFGAGNASAPVLPHCRNTMPRTWGYCARVRGGPPPNPHPAAPLFLSFPEPAISPSQRR